MLKNSTILWVFLLLYRAYIIVIISFHCRVYIVSFLLKSYKRFCYADVYVVVSLFQEVVNSSAKFFLMKYLYVYIAIQLFFLIWCQQLWIYDVKFFARFLKLAPVTLWAK